MKNREDLGLMCEERHFRVGAELGVQRGEFSKSILSNWKSCTKYILVDIWAQEPESKFYRDPANVPNNQQQVILSQAKFNVKEFGLIPEFMKVRLLELVI